jgi:hypothetical protein
VPLLAVLLYRLLYASSDDGDTDLGDPHESSSTATSAPSATLVPPATRNRPAAEVSSGAALALVPIGLDSPEPMPSFGRPGAAEAIHKRVGSDASYPLFTPPRVSGETPRSNWRRFERLLWVIALILFVVVLVLSLLVVLGL